MLCFLQQTSNILDSCLSMDLNETTLSFNFSLFEAYNILRSHQQQTGNLDKDTEYILIGIYTFLIVAGLSANLVVSFVVARRPQMHTARNLYIANLTISDMTLCVICMPFTLVTILRRHWSLGLVMCKLVPTLQGTNIMVSIGTITVIALDRYFTIVRGQDSATTKTRVVTSIALVWCFSTLAALPVFIYQSVVPFKFHHVVLYDMCMENWPSMQIKIFYGACVLLVQAVIPAAVVGVVHARIASYLSAHAKTQRDSRRAKRELQRNRRTTLILSCVAVLFAISWLPLGLFSLVADLLLFGDPENPLKISPQSLYVVLAICHITAMSSAVTNPIVYGWLNSNIRHEFLQLLPSKCARSATHPNVEDGTGTTRTGINARKESVTVLLQNGQKPVTGQSSTGFTAL